MKSQRIKAVIAATIGLLLVIAPSAEAGRKISSNVPQLGLWFKENSELTTMNNVIYGKAVRGSADSYDWKMCGEITSQICTDSEELMIIHYLPVCATDSQLNCIASAWAVSPSGERIEGKVVKRLPAKGNGDFSAVPAMRMPAGNGVGTIFNFAGVKNSGGSENYLVVVRNQFEINKKAGQSATDFSYQLDNFRSGITPVEEVQGNYVPTNVVDGFGANAGGGKAPDGSECQVTDFGICETIREFPEGYQFGMKIRTSNKMTGWFHGRMHSPIIESTPIGGGEEISIQATPVKVTALDYLAPTSEYSREAQDLIFSDREWGVSGDPREGIRIVEGLDQESARTIFKLFNKVFKDTSSFEHTYWTVNTLGYGPVDAISRCSDQSGKLAGIVTTNSLLYSAGPPAFNKESDSLDYQLASPHFESTGKEATGSYDLLIRADVARCIYGFSKAPISASISILSSEGDAKVATTVLGEKNGWLFVSAQGFGFSSPTVRVKLTQEAPVVVAPTPSATPSTPAKAVSKVVKITCVKGSKKVTVSGIKPLCAKGYKLAK